MPNNLTPDQLSKLNYDGEMTLEALATLDAYMKSCCNASATARKLHKGYLQVRRFLKQPYVREIFQLKLMERGITPEKIAEVIKGGVEATNGVYYEGNKVADENNWMARQKFLQLACEIFEVLKYNAKVDVNSLIDQSTHQYFVVFRNHKAIEEENASDVRPREIIKDAELSAR